MPQRLTAWAALVCAAVVWVRLSLGIITVTEMPSQGTRGETVTLVPESSAQPAADAPSQIARGETPEKIPEALKTTAESPRRPRAAAVQVVFSTDCSAYQDWQSLVVWYSAQLVQHEGPITRIASGCRDSERERLTTIMEELKPALPWARIHFTPKYSEDAKTGKNYHFYNKPRGILHWLQHGRVESDVVALTDPDQLFLRKLTPWVANETNILVTRPVVTTGLPPRVARGSPVAQYYGLGDKWVTFNREYICGAGSPCLSVSSNEAWRYYSVGPPYILHVDDWSKIAQAWVDFVPKVYEEYPNLLAEMYAYCLAAAHHELPHYRIDSYMVSNVGAYGEAWLFVDSMQDTCSPGLPLESAHPSRLPTFLHYCQSYRAGKWSFSKRAVPKDLFTSCKSHFLKVPLPDALPPGLTTAAIPVAVKRKLTDAEKRTRQAKRSAFMTCATTTYVNRAMSIHRKHFCPSQEHSEVQHHIANGVREQDKAGGPQASGHSLQGTFPGLLNQPAFEQSLQLELAAQSAR